MVIQQNKMQISICGVRILITLKPEVKTYENNGDGTINNPWYFGYVKCQGFYYTSQKKV